MINFYPWKSACIKNKTALQHFFTKRVLNKNKSEQFDKLLFLGGSFKENDAIWVSFVNGLVSAERLLERTQEEPDDQFFFFMQTTQQKSEIIEVLLLHLLTDIFLSTLHHFCKLKYFDLEKLWFQVEKIPSLSSPFMILPMI